MNASPPITHGPGCREVAVRWRRALMALVLAGAGSVAGASDGEPLRVVDAVDLDRYAGVWYEVARMPNRFQRRCIGEVSATYRRLPHGEVEVINRCREADGRMAEARGVARVVDPVTNAKLRVSFVSIFGWRLFWGDYWILALGEDYEYAVIGGPARKYAWILARAPALAPARMRAARKVLTDAGYAVERLIGAQRRAGGSGTAAP